MNTNVVIPLLQRAHAAELETIRNYLACLIWLDRVRAQEVFDAVASHIVDELDHAKKMARRLGQLGASAQFPPALARHQVAPPMSGDSNGLQSVVADALSSKLDTITAYQEIIATCQDTDPVTANLATSILADEEAHRIAFTGLLQNTNQTVVA